MLEETGTKVTISTVWRKGKTGSALIGKLFVALPVNQMLDKKVLFDLGRNNY
jgi:hypothetical protein